MTRRTNSVFLPAISVDRKSEVPLYKQLYEEIRKGILRGTLHKGLRVPSSRTLAEELRVSRNIVVLAFEQLLAEGYLESKTGAGTFVTNTLPDEVLQVEKRADGLANRALSERGKVIRKLSAVVPVTATRERVVPFCFGLPALEELPLNLWGRLLARHCRKNLTAITVHGDPAGFWPLREAIASYVGVARGVRCRPEQVIVINGSQQAIDLSARVLADPGDTVIVEDPGYVGARSILQAAGLKLAPVAVEADGLCVDALWKKGMHAKLAYVTPSHQFPLGVVLSLQKRLQLLDWATHSNAWILEDDFDSEYRYETKPLSALQGLDRNGRVIYIGTFSKVLFPSLRLGYMIIPEDLVDAFIAARWVCDRCSPFLEQAALTDFITEGHFASHIRRMRTLYMERRTVMLNSIHEELGDLLQATDTEAGMHFVGWLRPGVDDSYVSTEAAKAGFHILPISRFALRPLARGGLLLGFSAFPKSVIRKGMRELSVVIKKCSRVSAVASD